MTKEVYEDINVNIGGVPSEGYNGNLDVFKSLSRELGYEIPQAYIDFLIYANGGHPEKDCFHPITKKVDKDDYFSINNFYSVGKNSISGDLEYKFREWRKVLGENRLPIGSDGGNNQIYLEFNGSGYSIWMYFTDGKGSHYKVANDFGGFLDSLFENPDYI